MKSKVNSKFPQEWKLSSLLNGAASHAHIDDLLDKLSKQITTFKIDFPKMVSSYQEIACTLEEAGAVICCLVAQDVSDTRATALEAKHTSVAAELTALDLQIDEALVKMDEAKFASAMKSIGELSFCFTERRRLAKERMSLEKELLAEDLSVSGHLADTTFYYTLIGSLEFAIDGKPYNISQIENLLWCNDRVLREKAIVEMERVLSKYDALFGQLLNKIIDFRLRLYKNRGWGSFLQETLNQNRMSKETLDTMWRVLQKNKPHLKKYLDAKAKLFGSKKLSFCDTLAPLGSKNESPISWDESCNDIIKQFGKVSQKLATFAKHTLSNSWVEAIPNEKKRAGGFCVSMTKSKETRIFMSFANTPSSKATLAHEIGHGYHAHVLYAKPYLLGKYPMNLAETASTMCEMIVSENALKNASDPKIRLSLLDDKLSRYTAYSMNLHMRFLFDSRMHEERAKGFLSPEEITALMLKAQKDGYEDHLESYFPHFWAYKMHFFFTDVPFYNWTYTFGFMFSLGLYHHLMKTGDFETKYDAILQDTGCMSVEELAKKHLAVDLTRDDFWQDALHTLNKDIDTFVKLSQETNL